VVASVGKSWSAWLLLFLIRCYIAFLSPFFGGGCRFHPSCSNYAHEAIARHGARRGLALSLNRLLRCHPFSKAGFDPVPELASDSGRSSRTLGPRLGFPMPPQRKQESAK
jgi:uncharacterized protein